MRNSLFDERRILPRLLILYGSETGTAQDFAESLWREARLRKISSQVMAMDDYSIETLPTEKLVVFVAATCGQGDAPLNMSANWRRLLMKDLSDALLANVSVAVVGLGDSSYEKYNFAAKRLFRRLLQLGATALCELALADDQHPLGIEGILGPWCDVFWRTVGDSAFFRNFDSSRPLPESFRIYRTNLVQEMEVKNLEIYNDRICFDKDTSTKSTDQEAVQYQDPIVFSHLTPYLARVVENYELHQSLSERSCRHIEFEISSDKVNYETGDHLGIMPSNDVKTVEKIGRLLNTNLDQVIELVDFEDAHSKPFPCPCTYRTALLHYVDICAPVKRRVLRALPPFTEDKLQREKLVELSDASSEECLNEYHDFIQRGRRSIVDVLEQFDKCKPPLDFLLEMLPRLRPRYYSISSSPNHRHGRVTVTALVVQYNIGRRRVLGICTNYLATMAIGDRCPIFVRKSTLRLPQLLETPVIMIGPGTGFAPFRGFLQERVYQMAQGKRVGEMILFFGCRRQSHDFIYRDEIEGYSRNGLLTELHAAFSRDQDEKVYVQHKLWDCRQRIWELIVEKAASIYVCGDAKNMARDVRACFLRIFQEVGGLEESGAQTLLKNMEKQRQYQADVWS